ncbi:condensation domain-containing protein, partial [Inquilinus sp. 2KB_12]
MPPESGTELDWTMNDIDNDALLALLLDDGIADPDAIVARPAGTDAPLSFSQQRLWFLQHYDPDSPAYNSVRAVRLRGRLDVPALEAAFRRVIERHAVLRTRFSAGDGEPRQVVLPGIDFALERAVLPASDAVGAQEALSAWLTARLRRPFDLAQPPLLRAALAQRGELRDGTGEWVLLLVMHHIVIDAWSTALLVRDLAQAYGDALRAPDRRGRPLPPLALDYADYALWQRDRFAGDRRDQALAHWRTYLGDEVPVLALPTDRPRDAEGNRPGGRVDFVLPQALARSVQALCKEEGCTPFVVLLAAWQILLGRLAGQVDFAVGVPNAARNRGEVQDLIGFFVNTQVYRARLDPGVSVRALCRRLRAEALTALDHADFPFELLLEGLGIARDLRHTPLFQSLFNFRTSRDATPLVLEGVTAGPIDVDTGSAQFDLSLDVVADERGIDCQLEYDAGLFDRATAERWGAHLTILLQQMTAQPDAPIESLTMLAEVDLVRLEAWAASPWPSRGTGFVQDWIAGHASSDPDRVSVVFGDREVSRGELERRANHLAHRLVRSGVGPD